VNPQSGPSIGVENDASPSRVKDEDLVVQARAHDPSAIEELVHRYQQKAYVVAFHLSDENEQDAEDLTQEAFLRAFQKSQVSEVFARKTATGFPAQGLARHEHSGDCPHHIWMVWDGPDPES
jgi:hypothetical protein